jgi:MFS transporter, MHS family, proline/betaine transporter
MHLLSGPPMHLLSGVDIPAGGLSDRIGRKPLLFVSTGGTLIMAWPLFWMMHHNDFFVILLGQIGFATLGACFWGVFPAGMVELTRLRTRCVVLSLGYNTVMAVLGGLTPMVAVYTLSYSGYDLSPAFPLMIAAAISLVLVLSTRETYQLHSVTALAARDSSRQT